MHFAIDPTFRTPTRCTHASVCGGCSLQDFDYPAQLIAKEKWVRVLFQAAITPSTELHPILPCQDPWRYRNKMEFSFSQDKKGTRYLGLMLKGGRGKVFNLEECHLTSPWFSEALQATRTWWESTSLAAYHPHRNTGSLRTLTLRQGLHTGKKMAIMTVSGVPEYALSKSQMHAWKEVLQALDPETSCFLCIQQAIKGEPTQFFEIHLGGPECLLEELHIGGFTYALQISPRSFFQPNTAQAEILYSRALEIAAPRLSDHVLDLYCGTATIGMVFARHVRQVTAIELNPYAIFDAEANCSRNNLSNLRLMTGDAHERLSHVLEAGEMFDLIIIDPPRTGLGPKALQTLLKAQAPRILYIACNPLTQSQEVEMLLKHGYRLDALQPVDQFPHTQHVENIVLLSKN